MKPICLNCLMPTEERVDITREGSPDVHVIRLCEVCYTALHSNWEEWTERTARSYIIDRTDLDE